MKKNIPLVFGMCAALCLSSACGGSSNNGSGGSGGDSGGSSGSSGSGGSGGSAAGGKGGSATGSGGSSASGGGGGPSSGVTITIDEYPMALAAAQCAQRVKCCMNTTAMCVAQSRSIYFSGLKNLKTGIASGNVQYDGKRLGECIAKLSALACDASQADIDAATKDCTYVKGTVSNGAECLSATECKDGYCDKTDPAKTTMMCIARKDVDAVCKKGEQCKSGDCKLAMPTDTEGKCAATEAPKTGICAALPTF